MSTVTAVPLQPVKRRVVVFVWIGVVLAGLAAFALARMAPGDAAADFLAVNKKDAAVVQTESGLQYKIIEPGRGAKPTDADVALVNYEGKLPNGTTFDKSQQPTPMAVAGVVAGFSEALKLMPKGAKYRFWIKPSLGYGAPRLAGAPPLEGKQAELATKVLTFDVELLDFLPETTLRQMQAQQQMQQQMMQQQGAAPNGLPPGAVGPPPGQ